MSRAFHAVVTALCAGFMVYSFKYSIENKINYKADEDSQIKIHVFTSFHPGPSPGVLRKATAPVSGLNGNLNIRRPFLETTLSEGFDHLISVVALPNLVRMDKVVKSAMTPLDHLAG